MAVEDWKPIDLSQGHNPSRYPQVTNSRLVNFYISLQHNGPCLFPTPGYASVNKTFGAANNRALFYSALLDGYLAVYDATVYFLRTIRDTPQPLTANSTLETASGTVYIAESTTTKIGFSDGVNIYSYDTITSQFQKVPDLPTALEPGLLLYFETYFITNDASSGRFYISDNNQIDTWNVLDWATINDRTVGLAVVNRQLLVFGQYTTGIFYNAGTTPFPFQHSNTFSIEYGCAARDTIVQGFGVVCWLATNRQSDFVLMLSSGGQPTLIGTENIDFLIDDLEFPQDSDAFMYQADGHIFYQINFTKDKLSLLYDLTTKKFSQITEFGDDGILDTSSVSSVKYLVHNRNKSYCTLRTAPFIYEFSNKIPYNEKVVGGSATEEPIYQAIPRAFYTDNAFVDTPYTISEMRVHTQQGVYINTDRHSIVRLSLSYDLGVTYTRIQDAPYPPPGAVETFVAFHNLGRSYRWSFKLEFISTNPVVVTNIYIRGSES